MNNAGPHVDSLDALLSLIENQCNCDQIQDVLRQAQKLNGDLRISVNKDELVFKNLRTAIESNALSMADAYGLLCDAEESGHQHIFFFKSNTEETRAACSDVESVAERLFGKDWRSAMGFPLLLARPVGSRWSDFRPLSSGTLGSGWVAKIYAGHLRWESEGKVYHSEDEATEKWKKKISREVQLVRWHAQGVLEFRTPFERTFNALLSSLDGLWGMTEAVLPESQFERFNLTHACKKLIDNHEEYKEVCRLGDARLEDHQKGSARITPPSGRDHLMSNVTREQAVKLYHLCNELVVTWFLTKEQHGVQGELRTVIGKFGPNNVLIRSRTTARAIQHVTDQLRMLSE